MTRTRNFFSADDTSRADARNPTPIQQVVPPYEGGLQGTRNIMLLRDFVLTTPLTPSFGRGKSSLLICLLQLANGSGGQPPRKAPSLCAALLGGQAR
jgi:hypothetical protein